MEHQRDNYHADKKVTTESGVSKIRNSCDHLVWLSSDLADLPHPDTPCIRCQHPSENWLCLWCKAVLCGRYVNRHMLQHHEQTKHCLVLGYRDLSVWCFSCEAFLNVQAIPQLQSLYQTAYRVKFGETLPRPPAESAHIEDIDQDDGCNRQGSNQREGSGQCRNRGRERKSSMMQGETTKKTNETPLERRSTEGAEGAVGVMSSSIVSESNENGLKINHKQCLCGQEAIVKFSESVKKKYKKYYTCKESKCDFFERCFDKEAGDVDTMLAENEALQNHVINLVNVAELRAEIQGLTATINMLESSFGLMKMMMLMNVFYGFMLVIVIVVVLFKV